MTRVDLVFPSMGGEARVRLESVLHDEAELEALADGIHSRIEAVEAGALALPPRQRAEPCSTATRARRSPPPPCCAARSPPPCGRPSAATGSSTRRCSASSSAPATSSRWDAANRADVDVALASAPPRRPAAPAVVAGRATASGSTSEERVVRAPGVRLDPGGIAKGMAADLAAASLPAGVRYAISCGGDLAVGGERPWDVAVRSARSEAEVHRLRVRSGGVATSGIGARIWQTEDGRYAHHVIDPATGRPAWTGLVAVTAVAGNALEAEVLAKTALLSGPLGARRLLRAPRRRAPARRRPRRDRARARRRAAAAARGGVSTDPLDYPFWLASRSAGVVAYLLLSASVVLGLAMSTRLAPGATCASLHERIALLALGAVAAHGLLLLPDGWLQPKPPRCWSRSRSATGRCGPGWGSSPPTARWGCR